MDGLVAVDQAVTLWINRHHSLPLDAVLMPVAWFGEAGVGWIVIALALLIFGRRRERLLTLIFIGGLVVTEFALMPLLRELWPRPRPYTYMEGIRQMGVPWEGNSFPSAHAHLWMQATVLYGVAYRRWLWPLVVLTVVTFYSRPYAGMHHAFDVVAGAAVGGLIGLGELAAAMKLGLIRFARSRESEQTPESAAPAPPDDR